ncbi:MAG: 6-phosphofructokinase [Planctomycetota bacterium]|nr:MAG: 6-phosphofructokinase [Planctomycetota bacterium]
MLKGNAIIGQSGGPTSVINASLAGIITAAKEFEGIKRTLGMRFGIEGFMAGNIIDLDKESAEVIDGLKRTPSSALGSCRHKLSDDDLPVILDILRKQDIHYIFMIGGNDTMDTIHRIEGYAKKEGYDLIGIGVPKTVDNDLFGTDHTPGFPSAARYIALSVMQEGLLARDMQKVDQFVVFQAIGRDAGWLTAASVAGKKSAEDAPHLLCLPERPFSKDKFLKDVKRCYDEFGFVSIVCGEGVTYADGRPVSASEVTDKFDNVEFGAMGGVSAATALHRIISDEFGFRGEFEITESLPMSAADRTSQIDVEEAYMCGKAAVELAKQGKTSLMVTLERKAGGKYQCTTGTIGLAEVAIKSKPMPDEFINAEGNFVTEAFRDYLRPLIGELPQYSTLQCHKA